MSATVTIRFAVGIGYCSGDYAQLHGNGGAGTINWDTPLTAEVYDLFPQGGGIFGWGHAPWGHHRWGRVHSMRTAGWGHLPWGHFPWGHGATVIRAKVTVDYCGDYKFGFKIYDAAGNAAAGTPDEVTVPIHIAPPAPTGLVKNSYNKDTDVLVLDAA